MGGIQILIIVIGWFCCYTIGYRHGKAEERERGLNDLKAEKDREREYNLVRHTAL